MKNCKTCNKEFIIKKKSQTFCSRPCQIKYASSRMIENHTNKPFTGKNIKCIVCHKEFYVRKYRIKKECTKYCSRSCLAKIHLKPYVEKFGFKSLNKPHHQYKKIKINGKWVREHRYVMEQHIGRKLEKWEHVHHINDDSSDNRIENLEVLSNSDHQRKEFEFRKKYFTSSFDEPS
jgi:hypothetical protein